MSRVFIHEERCKGTNCLLKTNCHFHHIPENLSRNVIRNFIYKRDDKFICDKYKPVKELEKLN